MQDKLKKLIDLVITNTIEKNLPTVVFVSEIEEADIIKKLFSVKSQKEYDEQKFTSEDWSELADAMLKLANIPLIIKQINSVENTINQINNFSSELENKNGLVIIESREYEFPSISTKENIIIKKI